MLNNLQHYQKTLASLTKRNRERKLHRAQGIDFCSNDYLALAQSQRIRDAMVYALQQGGLVGSGGSRLLRGHHDVFDHLESEAAQFFASDAVLYFASGYAANLAVLSTLPKRGDVIIYDKAIHASIWDGMALGRAETIAVAHNDLAAFALCLKKWRQQGGRGQPWVVVESIYSMDGDCAPLIELYELVNQYDGFLIIDEAHATGVLGEFGKGLSFSLKQQDNVIVIHTCGKALGVSGALVCLNKMLRMYLINRARPFIYSTAPSPLMAIGVSEALKIMQEEPWHQKRLQELYLYANQILTSYGYQSSGSHIIPFFVNANYQAVILAEKLQSVGFDVRAIRPPTVPEGSARLRISITLHVSEQDILDLFKYIMKFIKEM